VNMFLFPSGLMLGGNFSIGDYLLWNEIPTIAGNMVGGLTFVGLTLYATHTRTGATRPRPVPKDEKKEKAAKQPADVTPQRAGV
ncbi:MAG TPA: formate/nitrite transporter family protein, partial [Spirillospora sp.]